MVFADPLCRWFETLLMERFGLHLCLNGHGETLLLRLPDHPGAIVFPCLEPALLAGTGELPSVRWNPYREGFLPGYLSSLPALGFKELPTPLIEKIDGHYVVRYDIPGLTYRMLCGLQEHSFENDISDPSNCFGLTCDANHPYWDRPLVDEWLHILGQVICSQWPSTELREHRHQIRPVFPVVTPARYGFPGFGSLMKTAFSQKGSGSPGRAAIPSIWRRRLNKSRIHPDDPANNFDWIMDQAERAGVPIVFYFCSLFNEKRGGVGYDIEHLALRNLIKCICERGHKIGLLVRNCNAFEESGSLSAQVHRLQAVLEDEKISQSVDTAFIQCAFPMHRLDPFLWEQSGISSLNGLGFFDRPGFRFGTCFDYPVYDVNRGISSQLRISPLVVAESAVVSNGMALGLTSDAHDLLLHYKRTCRVMAGRLTLSWNSDRLFTQAQRSFFADVLGG